MVNALFQIVNSFNKQKQKLIFHIPASTVDIHIKWTAKVTASLMIALNILETNVFFVMLGII